MIRNLKVLGLALVAVLAMTAVAASAASASQFEADVYPVTIEGDQTTQNIFTAGSASATCNTALFHGDASAASSTVTIHPTFAGCTVFGFLGVTVDTAGCDIQIHSGGESPLGGFAGTVDVVCEPGDSIKVTASTCSFEVPPQTGLGPVSITNNKDGSVLVDARVTGIAYTITNDGFLCPLPGKGNFTNGTYTGKSNYVGNGGANGVRIN